MKTLSKHKVLIICMLSLALVSCDNSKKDNNTSNCENAEKGKIVNLNGLDGCGWLIELDNGSKIIPTNLDTFDIEIAEGKKVNVNYTEKDDMAGICMAGKIAEINCINQ